MQSINLHLIISIRVQINKTMKFHIGKRRTAINRTELQTPISGIIRRCL